MLWRILDSTGVGHTFDSGSSIKIVGYDFDDDVDTESENETGINLSLIYIFLA